MTKQSGVPEPERPLEPTNDTIRIATGLGLATRALSSELCVATVEATIQQRALRSKHVPGALLNDPAWDMLLELFHAELGERRVTPSVLCKAAGVSASAGQRWIDALISRGLCTRFPGPDGRDGIYLELSGRGSEAMCGYFTQLAHLGETR